LKYDFRHFGLFRNACAESAVFLIFVGQFEVTIVGNLLALISCRLHKRLKMSTITFWKTFLALFCCACAINCLFVLRWKKCLWELRYIGPIYSDSDFVHYENSLVIEYLSIFYGIYAEVHYYWQFFAL